MAAALVAAFVIGGGVALWPRSKAPPAEVAASSDTAMPAAPANITESNTAPSAPAAAGDSNAAPPTTGGQGSGPMRPPASGQNALILSVPWPSLMKVTPPQSDAGVPAGTDTPKQSDSGADLPEVTVSSPGFHVVPDDRETQSMGPVTLTDKNGKTLRVVPPAAPSPPPVASNSGPGVGPGGTPHGAASAPKVAANPPVFSGRAKAMGGISIDVQGKPVQLFGVRAPETKDRCDPPSGKPQTCIAAAESALKQRFAGHSIVACRVPPGQPRAICLDEEGTDLGRFLVIQGLALSDQSQSYDYLPAETAARSAKRGLWLNR